MVGGSEQENIYSPFQLFKESEWKEWLGAYLSANPRPPFIPSDKDHSAWHPILIRLFENLEPKSSVAFNRALFKQFEETAIIHKNGFQLYTLLHVIAASLPGEAKPLLRRRLREGVFRRLNFENRNLHTLLLAACSKFHVDDELAAWIQRSARNSRDFDYLLLCQWVLTAVEGDQAFYFLERLIPVMSDDDQRAETARQLISVTERLGYRRFFNWFQERSKTLRAKWPVQWELFVRSLKERLLTDSVLPAIAELDPDAVLLYAELRVSREERIPLETVLKIARLHTRLESEATIGLLFAIWTNLFDRSRSGDSPWEYTAAQVNYMSVSPQQGTLFSPTDGHGPPPKLSFRVDLEPETENVLIEVQKKYDSMRAPAPKAVKGAAG